MKWPGRLENPAPVQAQWPGTPERRDRSERAKEAAPGLREGDTLQSPTATDGDTVRADNGRVRLWGMDAPEIDQQGYTLDGPVPIGRQAQEQLGGMLDGGEAVFGNRQRPSFGRNVGTLSNGGTDYGLRMIRDGVAVAVPEYLKSDPDRQFDYGQAERLARLNRLGMHDTLAQEPAEFRSKPLPSAPPRETVAQFFDTPTPWAGLSPDAEKRFMSMAYDPSVPIAAVVAYAKSEGALVDPGEVKASRDYYLQHGEAGGINYAPQPKVMTDLGDGAVGAGTRAFAEGFLAGGLDEAGAFADMLGGTGGRENIWNSDRRLADIWYNNQQQNAAILRYDDSAHPVASTVGEVGGALVSGVVVPYGAGARTAGQLARVGGVYGGAAGFLGTEGSTGERLVGAAKAAPVGALGNAALGKAIQVAAPVVGKGVSRLVGRGQAQPSAPAPVLPGLPGGPSLPPRARAMAMEAEAGDAVAQGWPEVLARAQRLLDPVRSEQLRATAARIGPNDVLPIPSNVVADAEDLAASQAGRFIEARVPNEREQLTRGVLSGPKGPVPKVGPVDLVGWLRLKGGLRDSGDAVSKGGDLKAMGIDNAARRGMDFVGQEARLGPLIADDGMDLDEAAEAAWEAGYFPELTERPTVNEFLEAVRETYNGGSGRRFVADDLDEIERYYAQQSDRYALEEQRFKSGEPVYADRSVPAQGDQPFAPVAAYEDWGPNPPDFAGNVNLSKLESPQDISRALSVAEREVGFDAATRGRVSQAETERLAAELNMKPSDLLKRRKGQALNAEEALAARQILAKSGNELVNAAKRLRALGDDPGSEALAEFREKWLRHVAIQEQVSGFTAEAGRTLQQFRMAANSRAVRADVLSAMARSGGGRGDLTEAADILIEAAEVGPGVFNALAAKAQKPKWRQKIGELYINMLLSNPPTHVVNTVSNTLTSIAQVPEYAAGALLGKARQTLSRQQIEDRVYSSEVGARAFGLVEGAKEGARLFSRALRTGEASDQVSKVEGDEFRAISGLKGEIIRIPTRFLTAEDEFFKGVARRMEINAQAANIARREGLKGDAYRERVAELSQNPTDEMFERALDYGRYLTFQRQLGETGRAVSQFTSSNLLGKIIMPFVRTPINLMKFAVERSPASPLLKEWRADFKAGGARRDMAVARAMIGTGFAAAMYEAAKNGVITGGYPPDPGKARLMRADGWQPYSIKIGDRYVSYSRLDPFSTTIGVAADMATLPSGLSDRQQDDQATMLVASIMGNLASKTWLSGVSDFVSALDDPQRYADSWIQRVASSFAVPAGVAGMARQIDPVARERKTVGEAIKARVPGMSDDLLPRRDVFGEIIETDSLGPDYLSPFWQSEDRDDPVIAEMLSIDKSLGLPGRQYTENGEKLDYSREQYDRYSEIAGRLTYNGLASLFASSVYTDSADAKKRRMVSKVIRDARAEARKHIDNANYSLPEKGSALPMQGDKVRFSNPGGELQWPGQPEIEDQPSGQWPGQPARDRDVVGKLRSAIPGVGIQSGYRTREYQADMRSRGYRPAENSRHLDGSALDLTPPPGRSMSWLMDRVQQAEPGAYILNEGDHLHVEFPDWNSAPAFGGALQAGLRNPMGTVQ